MKEKEFNQYCDKIMMSIEDTVDHTLEDIDCETSAGILTLTIEKNGSKIIISRQPSQSQIWVAAKSGGYYFEYLEGDQWVCTTSRESLGVLLKRVCFEQQGGEPTFDI